MTTARLPTRRVRRRRRLAAALAVVVAVGAAAIYVPVTLLAPLDAASAVPVRQNAVVEPAVALAWPGYGASAIGAEGYDGVLAASGTDAALPIASISKIVTALVVLERAPLASGDDGPSLTLNATDAALYGSYLRINAKVVPSPAGLTLTQRQLLEVMLVSSANNYAETIAVWTFGSMDAYVAATRTWLAENGLDSTTIVEPTGMSPQNTSTSTDLVALGKLALADPVVAEIVGTASIDLPVLGTLHNSNDLLGVDGVDGIKTGTLDEAGACLLFSADYPVGDQTVTVVGVVLGGTDHETLDVAIRSLLDTVESGFREVPVAESGESFATFRTPWEARADAVATTDMSLLVWDDTPVSASVAVDDIAPTEFGRDIAQVGRVTFTAGPNSVSVPLELDSALAGPDPWWMLTHPFDAATR